MPRNRSRWAGRVKKGTIIAIVRVLPKERRRAVGLGTPDPVELDAIASTEAGPEARAQLAQVYALLQTVPPDERIAWTLRHVERHRLEAVAELCACSLATAKRRIQRAQRYLAEHFVTPYAEEST